MPEVVITLNTPWWIDIIRHFFKDVLGGIAVPTFFIFSGYLTFIRRRPYKRLLKSRVHSLLIPYLFWLTMAAIVFFASKYGDFLVEYVAVPPSSLLKKLRSPSFVELINKASVLINSETIWFPFAIQLWYLQDLIVLTLICPIIKALGKKAPLTYLIAITVLKTLSDLKIILDPLFFFSALFFYSLGFYLVSSISRILYLIDNAPWGSFIAFWLLGSAFNLFLIIIKRENHFVTFTNLVFTIALALKWAGFAIRKERLFLALQRLSVYSFWIYLAHLPVLLPFLIRLSTKYIPSHGAFILLEFFTVTLTCIGLLLVIGSFLRRKFPRVFSFITGQR